MFKNCAKCKQNLSVDAFRVRNPNTGSRAAYCFECQRQISKAHYSEHKESHKARVIVNSKRLNDKNRSWFADLKSKLACERCGQNHMATLDFHHTDPSQKDMEISNMLASYNSQSKILSEIAKCEVLCSNCHRIHHWNEKLVVDI